MGGEAVRRVRQRRRSSAPGIGVAGDVTPPRPRLRTSETSPVASPVPQNDLLLPPHYGRPNRPSSPDVLACVCSCHPPSSRPDGFPLQSPSSPRPPVSLATQFSRPLSCCTRHSRSFLSNKISRRHFPSPGRTSCRPIRLFAPSPVPASRTDRPSSDSRVARLRPIHRQSCSVLCVPSVGVFAGAVAGSHRYRVVPVPVRSFLLPLAPLLLIQSLAAETGLSSYPPGL